MGRFLAVDVVGSTAFVGSFVSPNLDFEALSPLRLVGNEDFDETHVLAMSHKVADALRTSQHLNQMITCF